MKKYLITEILVLIVLIAAAISVCVSVEKASSGKPADPTASAQETAPTTTAEPEPTWMTFPADRVLTAQQYFVYDCDEDRFVCISGEPDERVYPASITKLFTAYIAMQYLQPEALVTAGAELDLVVWGSSLADIQVADTLSVEQLIEAMLLPSGNDAAYVLATAAGRVILDQPEADAQYAVETFVAKMNEQAKALGMTASHFVNPDGIHSDEHYMSMADLTALGKLALSNPTIMKYASEPVKDVTLADGKTQWKNTNALIHPESEYYCPYALGLKTGQTPDAGSCLLSAYGIDGRTLIIGVFGCPEMDDRFADTLQLFNETLNIG